MRNSKTDTCALDTNDTRVASLTTYVPHCKYLGARQILKNMTKCPVKSKPKMHVCKVWVRVCVI